MITIAKVLQATNEFVKVLRYGLSDVSTPEQALPFGIDSKPIKNKRAVVLNTARKGKNVTVGYLIQSELTESGETRIYSTDNDGIEKFYVQLFKDGTCEIGGDADNMVRYAPLNNNIQDFKNQIQAQLVLIQTGIVGAGGAYTPGTLTVDISTSKIDEVKTTKYVP